jgi:hypothetical protein
MAGRLYEMLTDHFLHALRQQPKPKPISMPSNNPSLPRSPHRAAAATEEDDVLLHNAVMRGRRSNDSDGISQARGINRAPSEPNPRLPGDAGSEGENPGEFVPLVFIRSRL